MDSIIHFRKSLRIFTFSLLAAVLLVIVVSASVSLSYKKALVRYMKEYLGDHLRTELAMDDIRFRLLKGFPKVTIEISNVVLHSGDDFSIRDFPGRWSDTLLQAKSLYLQFDLLKMIRKQYELKKIEVTDGTINILFDKQNRHNLSIWKSEGAEGNKYSVNLRNIEINNTRLRVYMLRNKFTLNARTGNVQFKGSFLNNVLSGDAKGNIKIRDVHANSKSLVHNASLQLDVKLLYDQNKVKISQGKVQLNKAACDLSCEYIWGKKSTIDLSIDIPKFGLDELMSLIPYETRFSTGNYNFNGNGRLHLTVKGDLDKRNNLLIRSDFVLNNCTANNTKAHSAITGMHMQGSVSGTTAKNFMLRIDTLDAI